MEEPFSLSNELDLIIERLSRGGIIARRLGDYDAHMLIARARELFVEGNPRAWWLALKVTPQKIYFPNDDALEHIHEFFPDRDAQYFLILEETDYESLVTQSDLNGVISILKELPFVEYYILNHELRRLFIESDHAVAFVVDAPMSS